MCVFLLPTKRTGVMLGYSHYCGDPILKDVVHPGLGWHRIQCREAFGMKCFWPHARASHQPVIVERVCCTKGSSISLTKLVTAELQLTRVAGRGMAHG